MSEPQSNTSQLTVSELKLGQNVLIVGSEAYLIDKKLEEIKAVLRNRENVDVIVVYGDEVKAAALGEILDTFTIFSSAKLVILKAAEKLSKKELEVLSEYYDNPGDNQSVVVVTEKTDTRFTAWKKISSNSMRINCDPPRYASDIKNWLVQELQKSGLRMDARGQQEFINRIELDYYWAANELTKLAILAGEARLITENHVLTSLNSTRAGTMIDFYRALGKRDIRNTLASIEKMLSADWEPLQVFFQFHKFYSIIWKILLLKQKHLTDNEISAKHLMDIYLNQRKEFLDFSKAYTLSSIEKIMGILLMTDARLKSISVSDALILDTCAMEILKA